MNELSEHDWELINAYHDGELGEAETRELETRIGSEPELATALESVSSISDSLGALRPDALQGVSTTTAMPANSNWHPGKLLAGGAVAAAFVLAGIFGPGFFAKPTAFEIHAELAGQAFSVDNDDIRPAAAGGLGGAPDLASANLTPVSFRMIENGSVTHYAGRNGCRLSYFRGEFPLDDEGASGSRQVETWTTVDNMRHMIVASGMDQAKFDTIAEYLRLVTRQLASEQMMASLSDVTEKAARCVG